MGNVSPALDRITFIFPKYILLLYTLMIHLYLHHLFVDSYKKNTHPL